MWFSYMWNRMYLARQEAEVVLVYAYQGGGGAAHLPYNSARIEALETDQDEQLPEVVRLAWMIAQLNVDLPLFSESIHRDRLPLVASLAMLPPTLNAAQDAELARCDSTTIRRAVGAWIARQPGSADPADALSKPLAFGSHRSKLIAALREGACGKRVELSPDEWLRLVTWVDGNAPYHDNFINMRPDKPAYDLPADGQLLGAIATIVVLFSAPVASVVSPPDSACFCRSGSFVVRSGLTVRHVRPSSSLTWRN